MEAENMLEVKQLSVAVGGREVLHDINLNIKAGETHVLCYTQRFSEGGHIGGLPPELNLELQRAVEASEKEVMSSRLTEVNYGFKSAL